MASQTTTSRLRSIGMGALLIAGACSYPTFTYDTSTSSGTTTSSEGTGGGGGTSPSSSTVSSGSGGGSSSSSSSSTTASSSSGSTCTVEHAGGGTCEYLPGLVCGCTGTKKCSVVDENTGKSACVFSGSKANFARCSTDADCKTGAWCNHATQACQPVCVNDANCTSHGGGQCLPALRADGITPIPDLKVCTAHCNPLTGSPCGAQLNCVYVDAPKEFECTFSKGLAKHTACTTDSDCALPFGCNDLDLGNGKECLYWCAPPGNGGASCTNCTSTLDYCAKFNPAILRDGTEYGTCSEF